MSDIPPTSRAMVRTLCERLRVDADCDWLTSRNKECDYSAAYIIIETNTDLKGQGMTFSARRLESEEAPLTSSYRSRQ